MVQKNIDEIKLILHDLVECVYFAMASAHHASSKIDQHTRPEFLTSNTSGSLIDEFTFRR